MCTPHVHALMRSRVDVSLSERRPRNGHRRAGLLHTRRTSHFAHARNGAGALQRTVRTTLHTDAKERSLKWGNTSDLAAAKVPQAARAVSATPSAQRNSKIRNRGTEHPKRPAVVIRRCAPPVGPCYTCFPRLQSIPRVRRPYHLTRATANCNLSAPRGVFRVRGCDWDRGERERTGYRPYILAWEVLKP